MERYRAQMLPSQADKPARWKINGRTMRAWGPWLKVEGEVVVVPAEQLEGAVEALLAFERDYVHQFGMGHGSDFVVERVREIAASLDHPRCR